MRSLGSSLAIPCGDSKIFELLFGKNLDPGQNELLLRSLLGDPTVSIVKGEFIDLQGFRLSYLLCNFRGRDLEKSSLAS